MQCKTCKNEMAKKDVMHSGNARYQRWFCATCRKDTSEALGIVGGMPKWNSPK